MRREKLVQADDKNSGLRRKRRWSIVLNRTFKVVGWLRVPMTSRIENAVVQCDSKGSPHLGLSCFCLRNSTLAISPASASVWMALSRRSTWLRRFGYDCEIRVRHRLFVLVIWVPSKPSPEAFRANGLEKGSEARVSGSLVWAAER